MFLKNYPFSKTTTLITFLMILSASFTRQAMDGMTSIVGYEGFKIFIIAILIQAGAVFFIVEARRLRNFLRILVMAGLLAVAFFLMWKIELPQVRMHILMYAIVGWFAVRDTTKKALTFRAIFAAWLFASCAGVLEEAFQKLLPYRYFDIQDIVFNVVGASLGVGLFLLRPVCFRERS